MCSKLPSLIPCEDQRSVTLVFPTEYPACFPTMIVVSVLTDATAVPAPDTSSIVKGMTIECLEDARRALAVAIVKMEANER